jgi:PAS domain S-box-containing protein
MNDADEFLRRLRALHAAGIALARAATPDDLCRRAVETGRDALGFDRISLWLHAPDDPDTLRGTFGTDEAGATRDERGQHLRSTHRSRLDLFDDRAALVLKEWPLLDDRGARVGDGWHLTAAVRDGDQVIGVLNADNLLRHAPLEAWRPELLALYGATVGHLFLRLAADRSRRESEAEYAAIVESASDAVVVTDALFRILVFNPAAERMFGWPACEAVGRPLGVLLEGARPAADTPDAPDGAVYYECAGRRRDGGTFVAEVAVSRAAAAGGGARFTALVRDLTERRQAEAARAESARLRAESALQQRAFLREVLYSVTEGRLRLAESDDDLPDPPGPRAGPPLSLSPPTLAEARHRSREAAAAAGLSEARAADLALAVGECAANALVHGREEASVRLFAGPGRVQAWIEDAGRGIDVADLPRATLLRGHSGGNSFGHGFTMVLQCVDAVHLLTGPGGTTVVLEQAADPPSDMFGFG